MCAQLHIITVLLSTQQTRQQKSAQVSALKACCIYHLSNCARSACDCGLRLTATKSFVATAPACLDLANACLLFGSRVGVCVVGGFCASGRPCFASERSSDCASRLPFFGLPDACAKEQVSYSSACRKCGAKSCYEMSRASGDKRRVFTVERQ